VKEAVSDFEPGGQKSDPHKREKSEKIHVKFTKSDLLRGWRLLL
jgi:hypothetical protein